MGGQAGRAAEAKPAVVRGPSSSRRSTVFASFPEQFSISLPSKKWVFTNDGMAQMFVDSPPLN